MSEYQYYEFQAVDRPLSSKEMATLRSYSTRARITPASFVNDYSWGTSRAMRTPGWNGISTPFYLANWVRTS